jgi:hypothetical protein
MDYLVRQAKRDSSFNWKSERIILFYLHPSCDRLASKAQFRSLRPLARPPKTWAIACFRSSASSGLTA